MPALFVDTSTDGATLVAAPSAPRCFIRVNGLNLTANGAVTVSLKSNTTTIWKTYITSDPAVKGGIVLPVDGNQTIDCAPGEALNIGLSAAVAVTGTIEYVIYGPPPS